MAACLTCGHDDIAHYYMARDDDEPDTHCAIGGCTCTTFEATDTPAVAGPRDLQHATHTATDAILRVDPNVWRDDAELYARIGVEIGSRHLQPAIHGEGTARVLRGMAYLQTGITDVQMDALIAGADALEQLQAAQTQVTALRRLLQDVVDRAAPHGEIDEPGGPYVAMYLLPTGPIHRALASLRDGTVALDLAAPRKDPP